MTYEQKLIYALGMAIGALEVVSIGGPYSADGLKKLIEKLKAVMEEPHDN